MVGRGVGVEVVGRGVGVEVVGRDVGVEALTAVEATWFDSTRCVVRGVTLKKGTTFSAVLAQGFGYAVGVPHRFYPLSQVLTKQHAVDRVVISAEGLVFFLNGRFKGPPPA